MPQKIFELTSTGTLRVVDNPRTRLQYHTQASTMQPPAEIHIFKIHKVTIIKPLERSINLTPKYHKHTCDPIHIERR